MPNPFADADATHLESTSGVARRGGKGEGVQTPYIEKGVHFLLLSN